MPIPARRTGVSPILGLIVEPVNGPMGVCWNNRGTMRCPPKGRQTEHRAHPCERLLFQVAGRLDTEDHADVMDALRCAPGEHHAHTRVERATQAALTLRLTSRNSLPLVPACRSLESRALTIGCERTWSFEVAIALTVMVGQESGRGETGLGRGRSNRWIG